MRYEEVQYAGSPFWKVLAGTPGPVVGTEGPLYRYTVYVQKGLGLKRALAAHRIDTTLADERGWTRGNVRFQRVAHGADTDVLIANPATVDLLCAPLRTEGEVSCCQGRKVVLNVERWRHAVPHWDSSLLDYRRMVINHEMGHRIGKGHGTCGGQGQRAPVMQQQTYFLKGCKGNAWPLHHELT